jgi:hypothetical protein
MPVVGRKPALTILPSGESLAVITEAAQYSLPMFSVNIPQTQERYYVQENIYPLGSRISYSLISSEDVPGLPVPILCLHKDAPNGGQPMKVFPLHNAVDLSVGYDATSNTVHCLWWWNGWTPDYVSGVSPPPPAVAPHAASPPGPPAAGLITETLPNPALLTYYAAHSVPDPHSPPWLRSLVPKTIPAAFDPTKPFWVAPIPEGYQFDYFPMGAGGGVGPPIIGESKVNTDPSSLGSPRMPDTPGARWLQDAIDRDLMDYPGPPPAAFGAIPSDERDDWERRGGVIAAGEHIRQASIRDAPEFSPKPEKNPYTNEMEPSCLPGVGVKFSETMTWEDHLIIVNALKAHYDHANLVNATRVLMYARGSILNGAIFKSIPKQFLASYFNSKGELESTLNCAFSLPDTDWTFRGPFWPEQEEETTVSTVILDFPQVVGAFPVTTNYRTLINPDKVWYPWNDYPDIGVVCVDDGFLVDSATGDLFQEAAVDWVLSDPCDAAAQFYDVFQFHLDLISY